MKVQLPAIARRRTARRVRRTGCRPGAAGLLVLLLAQALVTAPAGAYDPIPLPSAEGEVAAAHAGFVRALEAGDIERAVTLAEETLTRALLQTPQDPELIARARFNDALARWRSGDFGGFETFVESIDTFEQLYGPEAPELIDPLLMAGATGLLLADLALAGARREVPRARRDQIQVSNSRDRLNEARRIARDQFGRGSVAFQAFQFRLAMALGDRARLRKVYFETRKMAPEAALLFARAAYQYGYARLSETDVVGTPDILLEGLAAIDEASIDNPRLELLLHARLVQAYEMLGERDAATPHCRAFSRLSGGSDDVFLLYQSEYQFRNFEGRFPTPVKVRVDVDATGIVRAAEVVSAVDYSQQEIAAALDAAYRVRFAPRIESDAFVTTSDVAFQVRIDGKPVGGLGRRP